MAGRSAYLALSVLILGSIVRYERDPFTWKSSSSQLLRRRQLMVGSVLLGQVSSGDTVPEFEAALATLAPGEMAPEPVETRYGIARLPERAEVTGIDLRERVGTVCH